MSSAYQNLDEKIREALESGGIVRLPDINRSLGCMTIDGKDVRLGLDSIRGLSNQHIAAILSERDRSPYLDIGDLLTRVPDLLRVPESIVGLAKSGCLDGFKLSRNGILAAFSDPHLKSMMNDCRMRLIQAPLFAGDGTVGDDIRKSLTDAINCISASTGEDSWEERFLMEKATLNILPSHLQMLPYANAMKLKGIVPLSRVAHGGYAPKGGCTHWGRISCVKSEEIMHGRAKGLLLARAFVEDQSASMHVRFMVKKSDLAALKREDGVLVEVKGTVKDGKGDRYIRASTIKPLPPVKELIKRLMVMVSPEEITEITMHHMKAMLSSFPGIDSVCIVTQVGERRLQASLPLRVKAQDKALHSFLRELFEQIEMKIVPDANW